MGKLEALALAAALTLSSSAVAFAADLEAGLPPAPSIEGAPAPDTEFSGWYLRGDVGVGISSLGSMKSTLPAGFFAPNYGYNQASLGDAAILGIGAGYQINNWFRADVTAEYHTQQAYSAATSYTNYVAGGGGGTAGVCGDTGANPSCFDFYRGSVQSTVLLANGYVNAGTWYGLTPFVGAGVGVAFNRIGSIYDTSIGNTGGGVSAPNSKSSLAWALMAGLDWTVTPRLTLELSYRYLNLGKIASGPIVCQNTTGCAREVQNFKLASNDIRLGMRWTFEPEPSSPPPPLVTKY